jgi:cytochrome c-type biogenesis protein CcmE
MSVDQELARAVAETDAEASVPAVAQAVGPEGREPKKPKGNVGLLIGLSVMMAGILFLVFNSGKDAAIYSLGVDKLMSEQARYSQRNVRVKGMLVKGSLTRRDSPCEYRFKLQEKQSDDPAARTGEHPVLSVQHPSCVIPDTFKDMPGMEVEVQAEGKLAADGKTFISTAIIAKCPSKYEMQQKSMQGELAPHAGKQASPIQTFAQKN